MRVYYLQNFELGWDNVVSIATSPQKCIEDYTDGSVILLSDDDVEDYLNSNKELRIDYLNLKDLSKNGALIVGTIDAYYKLIKRRIEKGQNIENPINNLIQINGKLPNIIKELIRDNILNELLK